MTDRKDKGSRSSVDGRPTTTKWPPAIGERYIGKWPPPFLIRSPGSRDFRKRTLEFDFYKAARSSVD
jgi:hypothetical protein